MGKSQAIRLGPFTGGMNTASDPTAVADTELVDIKNLELDIDGSLVSRPPIVETTNNGVWTNRIVMIGKCILNGVSYVIGSNENGTYAFNGVAWTTIKAGLQSRVALQFQDYLFIVAITGSAQNGGYWDGATFTTDANMPKGEAAVFHKARMFVCPGLTATGPAAHQVKYTDPISISTPVPFTWSASGVVSVGQGDGENLMDVLVYNDNLVLFKQDSTYVLAYDTQPVDAILRKINANIGATARRCVCQYENSMFVFHEGNIFEIINYDFQRINFKVPFLFDGASAGDTRAEQVFTCILGDRLVVRYFNRIYVYGLKTRTWSRWESKSSDLHNFGPLVEFPSNLPLQTPSKFYAGSSLQTKTKMFYIQDGYDAVNPEQTTTPATTFDIECYIKTKNYDLADSHHYKKLYWWGADIVSVRDIVAIVNPITTETAVTWDELSTLKWDDLLTHTWANPLTSVGFDQETDVADTSTVGRKFVKFKKALRWRQINYELKLLNDGTVNQGPCRIFTFTVLVSSKQTVVKQVN